MRSYHPVRQYLIRILTSCKDKSSFKGDDVLGQVIGIMPSHMVVGFSVGKLTNNEKNAQKNDHLKNLQPYRAVKFPFVVAYIV